MTNTDLFQRKQSTIENFSNRRTEVA